MPRSITYRATRAALCAVVFSGLALVAGTGTALAAKPHDGGTVCTSANDNWWYHAVENYDGYTTPATGSSPISSATSYESSNDTEYLVSSDYWDPQSLSLTTYGCNFNSFSTTGYMNSVGGQVQAYPESWVNMPVEDVSPYYTLPLSDYASITSKYGIADPPTGSGLDYEAAYDDYACAQAGWGNDCTELMDWTYNDGQYPACYFGGTGCISTTETVDGISYDVYVTNGGVAPDIVTYEQTTNTESGTSNQLDLWTDASDNGWTAGNLENTYLMAEAYGFEICATPSTGATFNVVNYDVKWTLTG